MRSVLSPSSIRAQIVEVPTEMTRSFLHFTLTVRVVLRPQCHWTETLIPHRALPARQLSATSEG